MCQQNADPLDSPVKMTELILDCNERYAWITLFFDDARFDGVRVGSGSYSLLPDSYQRLCLQTSAPFLSALAIALNDIPSWTRT